MATLLVIDDDKVIRTTLELAFSQQGYNVITAGTVEDGLARWVADSPDIILLDLSLPDGYGLDVLSRRMTEELSGQVIMITGHQDLDKAIDAMRGGAYDYVHKPLNIDELELVVQRAMGQIESKKKLALVADLASDRSSDQIVGSSRSIIEIHKKIGLASRSNSNVLITGESGTGKELVARAIHRHSSKDEPFIPVNCSALVPTLIESELFGHEKGAFTGADASRPGRFELAGTGTLFLDEIGDLDLSQQVKILRVLQERSFERVGSRINLAFNARIIAATHQDLNQLVQRERFREDLYYRLKVVEIFVPPLRERKEDIPALVEHLLIKINRELRRNVTRVSSELMGELQKYAWPGNIRELENRLTAGVILSPGETLDMRLSEIDASSSPNRNIDSPYNWNRSLDNLEREHILQVLKACQNNLGRTCEVLKISRPTLRRKMDRYQITLD